MLSALRTRAAAAPVLRSAARSMSIFGAPKGRTQPPMDEPFPDTPAVNPQPHPVPEVKTSTTSNGVRVVSVEANQPVSRVTILSATGSKFETDAEKGSASVLKSMGLCASNKRSALRLIYDVETAGGAVSVSSDRDVTAHSAMSRRGMPAAFHALAESITDARMREWEVEEAIEATRHEASALSVNQWAADAIHAAAFREDSALGSPFALPSWNAGLSATEVLGFRKRMLVGSNVVIVGTGVEHSALERLAEGFDASPSGGAAAAVKAEYVGGCVRERTASSLAHVGVAFGVAGESAKDFAVAQVLSALLGGSPSNYKYKVPGSGMTCVLATEVQAKVEGVISLNGFLAAHPEASLVGAFATTKPEAAGEATVALAKAFSSVAATPVAADVLARAKAVAKGTVARHASGDEGMGAALARSTMVHGSPVPLSQQLAAIDGVTAEQVHAAAKAAVGKRPTLVATGAVAQVPHFDDFAALF